MALSIYTLRSYKAVVEEHNLVTLPKKRTGKSRPEFKGENMKNMFTLYDDFVAKMLGKCVF